MFSYINKVVYLCLVYDCVVASSLEERLEVLEKAFELHSHEFMKLRAENQELKARIISLEGNQGPLMKDDFSKNESFFSSSVNSNDLATSQRTGNDFTNHKNNKRQVNEFAAFHVYLNANTCFNDHQIIEFNGEELDIGNGFNPSDGIYIVPIGGVYVFSWTFLANNDEWAETELVINGVAKEWTISDSPSGFSIWSPASNLVVAEVNTGDHVFIRRVAGRGCTAIGGHGYTRSNFSGWLLVAM